MVAIRLTRTGAKKKPTYRVVVTDKRRPRDSKTLETVGFYNPRPDPIELSLQRDRIDYWVGVGAQPSETVKRLIKFFDAQGPTLSEPKKKAMQAAAEAATPTPRPEPKPAEVEAAPEAEAKPDGDAEATTDAEAKPEGEAKPEAEDKPEAEAAPAEAATDEAPASEEMKTEEKPAQS